MTSASRLANLARLHLRPWREIALLMLMIMEISWVTPWFRSLTPATYATPPAWAFLIFLMLILASHLAARSMEALHLRSNIRKWVTVGLLVLSVMIGLRYLLYPHEQVGLVDLLNRPLKSMMDWRSIIPDEFIIILAVLIGWWRGISLSQEYVEPSSVMGYFRTGIFMFLAYVVFNTLVTGETPGGFIYLFLFASLISMSAARMSVLSTLRGGRPSLFDRKWFGGMVIASIIVALLATGLGETFGGNLKWFSFLIMGIFGIFAVIVWAIITPVLALVIYLVRNTQGDTEVAQKLSESINQMQQMVQGLLQKIAGVVGQPDLQSVLRNLVMYLRTILLWSVILAFAAGILIWVVMQIRKDRQRKSLDEEQQSILSGGDLLQLIRAFLRQRWENLVEGVVNVVDLRRRLRARAAARVRQIYTDLLELADELGCARQEAQTPLEFLPVLEKSLTEVSDELALITRAYVKVRYGQLPEDHQEVVEIEVAWSKVGEVGKQKIAELERQKSPPTAHRSKGATR